jgi:glycosyltransferase involved in cell wall biosynthesis
MPCRRVNMGRRFFILNQPLMDRERLRFLYFTPSDLLIPRVDRTCIMRFCEALKREGCEVEAVSLNVRLEFDEPTRTGDLFDVYGIRTPFLVTKLPSLARQSRDSGSRLWRSTIYGAYTLRRLLSKENVLTVAYFKNYLVGVPLLVLRRLFGSCRLILLFEIHVPPTNFIGRALLGRFDGLIPVSRILGEELKQMGINPERILVAHQGVDLEYVEAVRLDKKAARGRLGLPADRRLVVYTGKVHSDSREIAMLLEATTRLPPDVQLVVVGGREDHVEELRRRAAAGGQREVRFVGFVPPANVFHYQMAADVLVTYYPSELEINRYRASPGKLFEYMAAKRPIVTADYAALREVLSPNAAIFVECDNPEALAEGITAALTDEEQAESLAREAYAAVANYSWEQRARRVCSFALALGGRVGA